MANIATQRIKREFKEVIKSEEVFSYCYLFNFTNLYIDNKTWIK